LGGDREQCEICQQYIDDRGAVVPCGHAAFCYSCIENWERQTYGSSCPTCRAPITGTQRVNKPST
jgi:hypothetical protein